MKHKKSSFFWNDILRSSWFELGVLGLFVAIALLAPLIAPYDPNELDLSIRLQGFNLSHLLGTDALEMCIRDSAFPFPAFNSQRTRANNVDVARKKTFSQLLAASQITQR